MERIKEEALSYDQWRQASELAIANSVCIETDGAAGELEEVIRSITSSEAVVLLDQVVNKCISVDQLRSGVAWANALEREAVANYGADLRLGEQREERIARRIMHHAGKVALNDVHKSVKYLLTVGKCNQKRILVQ